MKAMHVLLVGLAVMALSTGEGVEAREWSEEIRMTDSNGYYMRGSNLTVEIDSRDNIHTIYDYARYEDDRLDDDQAVYQKFNRYGEALTDPLVLGHVADWPDSTMWSYDLFIDNEDNVYILWGNRDTKHYTSLDCNGEVLVANVLLGGLRHDLNSNSAIPQMIVDSGGNVILLVYFRPEPVEERDPSVIYSRYTSEGEMIDSFHVIWIHPVRNVRDLNIEIDENDVIYIAWEHQSQRDGFTVHYSVVAPDDEIIIDDFSLPPFNWDRGIIYEAFAIDEEHRPLFTITSNSEFNMVRYNSDLEREFTTYLGHWRGVGVLQSDIVIDEDSNIHVICNLKDDDLNDGTYFLGYAELNSDGEITDSLQVVHDPRIREGGRNPSGCTGIQLISFSDNIIGVIWADNRHADYERGIEKELYMRYSIQDNSAQNVGENIPINYMAILPNYPNPFNDGTILQFQIKNAGIYLINIFDLEGKKFFNLEQQLETGVHSIKWDGNNFLGLHAPSGQYILTLSNREKTLSSIITLAK